MKVSDLMSSPLVSVTPCTNVREAAVRMDEQAVGSVLVYGEGGLCGILTDRDLVVRVMAAGLSPETPVSDVMSAPLVTIGSATDLDTAYRTFRRHGVRRLPVLTGSAPIGMLSVDDLLRDAVQRLTDLLGPISWSALRDERRGPEPEETGTPPAR